MSEHTSRRGKLDPAPITWYQSNTIRALIAGLVALLAALGVEWRVSDDQIDKIARAVEILGPMISGLVAAYYRTRATKIVDTPAANAMRRAYRGGVRPPVALLLASLACAQGGCSAVGRITGAPVEQPPLVQIYAARQAYIAASDAYTLAVNAHFFDGNPAGRARADQLATIVEDSLNKAEVFARGGSTADWRFWLGEGLKALDQFIAQRAAVIAPTTRPGPAAATRPAAPSALLLREVSQCLIPSPWACLSRAPSTASRSSWTRGTRFREVRS